MNKPKVNSIVLIAGSTVSILITVVLLKTTNLGIYAIAGTSTVVDIIRILTFVPMYAASLLKIRWHSFYGVFARNILSITAGVGAGYMVRKLVGAGDWLHLIPAGVISAVLIFSPQRLYHA